MNEAVRAVLDRADGVEVTALPDGSVDHRYQILGEGGAPMARTEFADAVAGGSKSFLLDPVTTEPGGMAVNAAIQTSALGAKTRLLGHLDHDVFDALDFDHISMGPPADVKIYDFEGDAIMLTDESDALRTLGFHDVHAALGDQFRDWFDVDAVVCSNWSSIPNMTGILEELATAPVDGGWFIVDPGDVTIRSEADIDDFVAALGALSDSFDVVLNPNDAEVKAIASARDITASSIPGLLDGIRQDAGISAAVVHAAPEAAVATREAVVRVPNYDTRGPVRFTGGGDRFTGGLAVALAAGAAWHTALMLANACATSYVASGATADASDLRDFPALVSPAGPRI